jgi:hypothetical protein
MAEAKTKATRLSVSKYLAASLTTRGAPTAKRLQR